MFRFYLDFIERIILYKTKNIFKFKKTNSFTFPLNVVSNILLNKLTFFEKFLLSGRLLSFLSNIIPIISLALAELFFVPLCHNLCSLIRTSPISKVIFFFYMKKICLKTSNMKL